MLGRKGGASPRLLVRRNVAIVLLVSGQGGSSGNLLAVRRGVRRRAWLAADLPRVSLARVLLAANNTRVAVPLARQLGR